MPKRNSTVRRSEIIDALLRVMADRGWANATVNRIAAEANITPGLIHYHFQNKQEILVELVRRLEEEHESRIEHLARAGTPTERVKTMVMGYLKTSPARGDAEAVATWVTITAESIRQPEVRDAFGDAVMRWMEPMRQAIEDGLKTGEFDTGGLSPEACAAAVLACVQGYYNLGVTVREAVPKGSAVTCALRMVAGMLRISDFDSFVAE